MLPLFAHSNPTMYHLQVENANTLSMKCSDVYLYESSLQPDQFGSLPKLQVSPKSLLLLLP